MSVYDLIDSLCSISDDYVVMDVTMNLPEVSAFDASYLVFPKSLYLNFRFVITSWQNSWGSVTSIGSKRRTMSGSTSKESRCMVYVYIMCNCSLLTKTFFIISVFITYNDFSDPERKVAGCSNTAPCTSIRSTSRNWPPSTAHSTTLSSTRLFANGWGRPGSLPQSEMWWRDWSRAASALRWGGWGTDSCMVLY